MPNEVTSPEVASEAAKILKDKSASPAMKKVAASALNQAPDKKRFICVTGMDFEGLKGKPRVEAGKPIPDGLTEKQIKEYLEAGLIKEA